ncbi:multidrug transporter subunit MdtD [Pigmentiphaga soli]|uniref:Multidrug transporter subunit MdtD n=1 Tax=Pigmentiphaga soli TaxID=1007095 RepID=A0ABP8H6G1_9BURK
MPALQRSLKPTLWLVAVGLFMQMLDSTIVNTALPAMAGSLGESPLRMQSVVISYALTMAVLIPASGWLADRFGTRRVFFAAIMLFTLGSALCAASQTLPQLVAARVVQGCGGAMLLPVGRLTLLRSFPREQLLRAMSFVAVPAMVGPLVGPWLGGIIAEKISWHWIFLINLPVGAIAGAGTWYLLADRREAEPRQFDLFGYFLLAFGMAAISLSLDGLSGLSIERVFVVLLLVFGLASVVAYWIRASRHPAPLFPLAVFHVHTFTVGLLGNLFARLGSGAMPYLLPLTLQLSLGYSPSHAGMMMLAAASASMLTKRLATSVIDHFGYRRVLVVNTLLVGAAMAAFSLVDPAHPVWLHVIFLAVFGAVNSLQFTAMNTLTLKDLDDQYASSGNSMLSMVQMLSMSMGVTVAAAILAGFTRYTGRGGATDPLPAFHSTFICVGLMTAASTWIFWQLSRDAADSGRRASDKRPADAGAVDVH